MQHDQKYPFVYIGHGSLNSVYVDKTEECYIWFKRKVNDAEKQKIMEGCPPPLAGFFYWAGEFLHFGCADDTYDLHIIKNYCNEETSEKLNNNDYSFFAGDNYGKVFTASLDRFADALEKWIIKVNSIVPVSFFIGPNGSSDNDSWNRWSRENLRPEAEKSILAFLENYNTILSANTGKAEKTIIREDGTIIKDLSPYKIKSTLGYILRFVIKFPKDNSIKDDNTLIKDLKIIEALFETDGLEHYIETLTYSDTRIKTNSEELAEVIKDFAWDKQIEIIRSLKPYIQLAFYASTYNNSLYLIRQIDPVGIIKRLITEQEENRVSTIAGLLYFMANNMVKVGPAYGDKNDFAHARTAAGILELSFDIEDVRPEAFINAAAFYDRLKDFNKMMEVSIKGYEKFSGNTTILANIIYSAQNLGNKEIADKYSAISEDITSTDPVLVLNRTYNFIKNGENEKARQCVLKFAEHGGVVSPQLMNNILYTYINGPADKYKEPFLLMTMNFAVQNNKNDFKTNKDFICNATIVLNNDGRYTDSEKLLDIYKDNGGFMTADIYNQKMYVALKLNDSSKVRSAVEEFVKAFQNNASIIAGHEYVLHSAASCFGFLNDRSNALEYVRLAEWNGYTDFRSIKDDEYLKILHNDPEFLNMFQ